MRAALLVGLRVGRLVDWLILCVVWWGDMAGGGERGK
jgi:hypothetical protein